METPEPKLQDNEQMNSDDTAKSLAKTVVQTIIQDIYENKKQNIPIAQTQQEIEWDTKSAIQKEVTIPEDLLVKNE